MSTQCSKSLLVKGTEKKSIILTGAAAKDGEKQETLETLRSVSKPEQSSLFVANEPWCFLIIYKPFKRAWWEDQGSQLKCFYPECGQETLRCFAKWGKQWSSARTAGFSRGSPRCLDPQMHDFLAVFLDSTSQAETPGNITREAANSLDLWGFCQGTVGFLSAGTQCSNHPGFQAPK